MVASAKYFCILVRCTSSYSYSFGAQVFSIYPWPGIVFITLCHDVLDMQRYMRRLYDMLVILMPNLSVMGG